MPTADEPGDSTQQGGSRLGRRKLLLGTFLASLAGAYGFFAAMAVKFIFPERRKRPAQRIFLSFADEIGVGDSKVFIMPSGDQLLLSNTGWVRAESGTAFLAFSNRCPHLGCKVHWEAAEGIFSCPCHQGVFDAGGTAISGPPAESGQSLAAYQLELRGDSIYALVEEA